MAIHHQDILICPCRKLRGHNVWKKRNSLRSRCTQQVHRGNYSFERRLEVSNRFSATNLDDLLKFQVLAKENSCHKVAVESTGNYWIPIYNVFGRVCEILFWQMPIRFIIFQGERQIRLIPSGLQRFV